jgi:hypothetical protein
MISRVTLLRRFRPAGEAVARARRAVQGGISCATARVDMHWSLGQPIVYSPRQSMEPGAASLEQASHTHGVAYMAE